VVAVLDIVDHLVPLTGVQATEKLLAAHPDQLAGSSVEVGASLITFENDDAVPYRLFIFNGLMWKCHHGPHCDPRAPVQVYHAK
jgi:hypothetical protein